MPVAVPCQSAQYCSPEDWQPEPSSMAEMNPGSGEIIWSTLFPSEVANEIPGLDVDD